VTGASKSKGLASEHRWLCQYTQKATRYKFGHAGNTVTRLNTSDPTPSFVICLNVVYTRS